MYKWINIGFPIYLVLFEIIVRSFISTDLSSFVGPALASAGMGILIGLLKPTKIDIDDKLKEEIKKKGMTLALRNTKDENTINLAWAFILVELLAWYYVCNLSMSNKDFSVFGLVPMTILIGCVCYFVSIGLSNYKEKL